jgi:hypothetical protein
VDVEDDVRPCPHNATSDYVNKDPVKQYLARADVFDDSDSEAEIDAKPDPHPVAGTQWTQCRHISSTRRD